MIALNQPSTNKKELLIEIVLREVELHRAENLESFSSNQELADQIGASKTSVIRYLRGVPEADRKYRTHEIISTNSKKTAEENRRLGKSIFALTPKDLSENGKKGGKKIVKEKIGIHGLGKDEIIENARKGGNSNAKNGTGFCRLSTAEKREIGLRAYEEGTGIHSSTDIEKLAIAKKGGKESVKSGRGVHALSVAERKEIGLRAYELGTGIHAMSFEEKSALGKRNARMLAERNMGVYYEGNSYHSASEAILAGLFAKYVPSWKVEKGKTWQIDLGTGIVDFLVNGNLVEYHPPKPFYGKSRTGDFRSHQEYVKYMLMKKRIRLERGERRARDFQKRVESIIIRKYQKSRESIVENSAYNGTSLIYCSSPEEAYDKIISQYPDTPTKQDFLSEFKRLRRQIIKNNKHLTKVA
jgi:hypothetical protein